MGRAKLNKAEAAAVSGVEHIYWHHEFDKVMKPFLCRPNIYTLTAMSIQEGILMQKLLRTVLISRLWRVSRCIIMNAAPRFCIISVQLKHLRIDLIQKACDITEMDSGDCLNLLNRAFGNTKLKPSLFMNLCVIVRRALLTGLLLPAGQLVRVALRWKQ